MGSLAVLGALVAAAGCTALGYRVGSTLPKGLRTVHVPTFANDTREPQIENDCTQAAIQEFQKDGTLAVAPAAEADSILEVTLADFRLEPVRYEKDRSKTTAEYRILIEADVVFRAVASGEVLVKRQAEGRASFDVGGDLTGAKRAAIPVAARDLAHDIVKNVVEYW
jgi:hypothetical protein